MLIKSCEKIDISMKYPNSNCDVYFVHVIIDDVEVRAKEMIDEISSTSWLERLAPVDRVSFEARSRRTVEKLVYEIFSRVSTEITNDFGEYMVSMSAQDALHLGVGHKKIPLAELFKEQMSGNPGFDFHTESHSKLIAFGEAKYSGITNPHEKALSQIVDFIELGKDDMEITDLSKFASGAAIDNALAGEKAYVAAFSVNAKNPRVAFCNALNSPHIQTLCNYPELYLIGVEVNDSSDI